MDDKSFHIRIPKRWARVAMIVTITALIVAPLTAIAAHTFTDVPDSNTFHEDISWLADAGITKGCNPSQGNTEFCPDDDVTRGQMSAFMRRFAQFIDAEDGTPGQADNATTADDADMLDGMDSTEFALAADNGVYQTTGGIIALTTTSETIIDMDVPPGSYLVIAEGVLNNNGGAIGDFDCDLTFGGASDDMANAIILNTNTAAGDKAPFTLVVAASVAATSTADLSCFGDQTGNVYNTSITATRVSGDINVLGSAGSDTPDNVDG